MNTKCLNPRCNKETENPKYCSRSCAAAVNNATNPKRIRTNQCKICSKSILSSQVYCSSECKSIDQLPKEKTYTLQDKKKRSQAVVDWRRRTKIKGIEYKGGECISCGYKNSIYALHFHHLDPNKKEFSITGKSISWERIKSELDKCVLLCANCHAEVHEGVQQAPVAGLEPATFALTERHSAN